ncbi:MAG: hypothetical protein M1817_004073 [Caeruleum heppii]|nr:MAG: hypothetical protein M1817_004073 [Caeruleum heppii]
MDKHTRPYLCTESSCALLKGFTYAGGLLRHEREVHSKHGGPRRGGADALRCPHPGCKRNEPGRGFTRNENLLEHLRRVHRSGGAHEVKVEDDVKALEPVVAKEDEATKCTTPSRKRKRVGDHHISPSQSSSSSSSPPTLRRSDEESFGLLLEDISSSASDAVDGNVKEAAVQMNMPLERQVKRLRRQNRAIILELRSLRAMIRGREGR